MPPPTPSVAPDELTNLYLDEEEWVRERVASLSPKARRLLAALARQVGEHVCVKCADIGANQPASQKRELKVNGFLLGERGAQRVCERDPAHGRGTHYVLHTLTPNRGSNLRADYTDAERHRIKRILGERDAITGAGSQALEVDHRVPMQRRTENETKIDLADGDAVRAEFCLLTREHNLAKDRQCSSCVRTGNRPAFLGVQFYFEGDHRYADDVGCRGCGWAYPEEWKERLREAVLGRLSPRDALSRDKLATLVDALGLSRPEEAILLDVLLERHARRS